MAQHLLALRYCRSKGVVAQPSVLGAWGGVHQSQEAMQAGAHVAVERLLLRAHVTDRSVGVRGLGLGDPELGPHGRADLVEHDVGEGRGQHGLVEMAARSMATRRARSGNVSRRPPGPLAASNFQARIRSTIGELSTTPVTFCTTASAKGRVPGASATISAPSPTSPEPRRRSSSATRATKEPPGRGGIDLVDEGQVAAQLFGLHPGVGSEDVDGGARGRAGPRSR